MWGWVYGVEVDTHGVLTPLSAPDWDINVGLLVALAVVAAVLAAVGAALYRLYYRKKKIRQYELQKEQQRLLALGGFSDGAAASSNGSAPVTQA